MKQKLLPSKARILPMLIFSMLLSTVALAQKTVTGKVTSATDNQPVSGATVAVKGSNVATATAPDGTFSISVPAGKTILVVSYIGFDALEVSISGKDNITIALKERSSSLSEVVVTGYTSQAKKDITGSVAVVNAADLKSIPAANAESQLQGRASGVTVVTDNRPGAGAQVRIRGFSSFGDFGQNTPLYVIDGVPADGLGGINPNDIESMQVLKDAASASIYGARASAGVLIITTKRGKQGSAKVNYNMYYGSQRAGKGYDVLNAQEMADLFFLAYRNAGQTPPATQYGSGANPVLPDYILPAGKFEGDPAVNPNLYNLNLDDIGGSYLIMKANKQGTNWFKEITQNAPIMNHNLSVSGGGDRSRYLMSLDYFDQDAIFKFTIYRRYIARVNTEFNVKKNIRIGQNLQILASEDNTVGNSSSIGGNSEGTSVTGSYLAQPIIPVFDIKGNFAGARAPNLGNGPNPYADLYRRKDNRDHRFNIFGNAYAEVDFLQHFTARTSFGGQYNNANFYSFNAKTYERAENNSTNSFFEQFERFRSWVWTNQLTYKNVFAGIHEVQALVGTEAVEESGRFISSQRANYFIEDVNFRAVSSGAAGQVAQGSPFTETALWSLFGKVDYVYSDKYLAGFTIRRDGSSRFGPNNPYGVFPAGSIGWRISREKFMQNVKWITDLKIRASYGSMGSQKIDPANSFTQFRGGLGSSNYDINGSSNSTTQGFQLSFVGNPDGKWETNITENIGFDATLFGGKTEVIFDVYRKRTEDLLFNVPAIATAGAGAASNPAFINIASMKNTGVDVLITQRGYIGGRNGVKFDATLTFTTYKNNITSLAEGFPFFETRGSRIGNFVRNQIGQEISSFFGYKVIGFFQDAADVSRSPVQDAAAPGRFKYADLDGDNRITIADRTFLGSPNPDFTYGLNLNGSYKGFDVSMFFYGSQGKESMNYVRWWTDFFPSFQNVKSKDALYNSWTPQRPNAKAPIAENASNFSNNNVVNSYYLEDASYFRMKNLTVGYTLPANVLNRFKIDRLRLYLQATNLFTLTKYTGLDPENIGNGDAAGGVDEGVYPTVRQLIVGLSLNF
jgi:TonB-dependent starch-binding outer membrane protein SusC